MFDWEMAMCLVIVVSLLILYFLVLITNPLLAVFLLMVFSAFIIGGLA